MTHEQAGRNLDQAHMDGGVWVGVGWGGPLESESTQQPTEFKADRAYFTSYHQLHLLFSQAPPPVTRACDPAAPAHVLRGKQSGADGEALPLRGCRFIARASSFIAVI